VRDRNKRHRKPKKKGTARTRSGRDGALK
jgi:hypothetical protein